MKIRGLWYDDPDILADHRGELSTRGGKHKGKWVIRRDPRDRRQMFFQDPISHATVDQTTPDEHPVVPFLRAGPPPDRARWESWQQWRTVRGTFVPAPRLTLAEYQALSKRRRALHDLHRTATHVNMRLQETPMSVRVANLMRGRLQNNAVNFMPGTLDDLVRAVRDAIRDHHTTALLIDDVTRLRLHREDDQDTLDLVRELMDLNVTLILIGVDIPGSGLLRGAYIDPRTGQWVFPDTQRAKSHTATASTQTSRRFDMVDLDPFGYSTAARINAFLHHLAGIEDQLRLLRSLPGADRLDVACIEHSTHNTVADRKKAEERWRAWEASDKLVQVSTAIACPPDRTEDVARALSDYTRKLMAADLKRPGFRESPARHGDGSLAIAGPVTTFVQDRGPAAQASSRVWGSTTVSMCTGCTWSTTARGRRRRWCSFTDRGPRVAPGARWCRHWPVGTTSSGSISRATVSPRPRRRTTCPSRQPAWLRCSTSSAFVRSPWSATPVADTSPPPLPNSARTWWFRSH